MERDDTKEQRSRASLRWLVSEARFLNYYIVLFGSQGLAGTQ